MTSDFFPRGLPLSFPVSLSWKASKSVYKVFMATVALETNLFFRKTLVGFVTVDCLEKGFDMVHFL